MGLALSSWMETITSKLYGPTQILILGLDNAGKTQTLYCMKLGKSITNTVPTLGFNLEEVKYKHLTIKAWDMGGQTKFREMWHHYYETTNAVIFVIDSADRDRFTESKKELDALLNQEELRSVPFLVFANKQDLPCAAELTEIKEAFHWHLWEWKENLHMVACTALNNHRVTAGMDWLVSVM